MHAAGTAWDLAVRLEGQVVTLEPLGYQHSDGLFEVARPPEIWDWWPMNPAATRATFDAWIESCLQAARDGVRQHFATLDARTGEPAGSTSYCTLRPEHLGIEIGWTWLTPSRWRTGANIDAKALMLGHAFDVLGCQRVEFETDEENERSRAALAALPAQFEGIHRDSMLVRDGVRRSSAYYSILDSEWPLVRENLMRRRRRAGLSA